MPSDDELRDRLASAAEGMPDRPVDIAAVTTAARRRMRVARIGLVAAAAVASLVVAGVAFAARDARDPGFDVPVVEDEAGRVVVPRVEGLGVPEAVAALEEAGLKAAVEPPACRGCAVRSQRPAPGTKVEPGAAVALTPGKPAGDPVTVPDVRKLAIDEARAAITAGKLRAEVEDECAEGAGCVVVTQEPAPGTKVAPGSAVALTAGPPSDPVTVPTVVGRSREDAVQTIRAARLSEVVEGECAPTAPACAVASQRPVGGQVVEAATRVTVVLAGSAPTTVPNLIGLPESRARRALASAGLGPGVREPCPPSRRCTVTAQDPDPNKQVPKGSTVVLTLVPTMTVVPNVIGRAEDKAAAAIASAQLRPVPSSCPKAPCVVVEQGPLGGTWASVGTSVTITLATRE